MARIIFDGENAIMGRLGSLVAKELLRGNEVIIINSERVLISGKKNVRVEEIRRRQRMGRGGSLKGPRYPAVSDRLLKRMIRGMLPWDKPKGRAAWKRLKCFIGNGELKEEELKNIKELNHKKPYISSTISEIVEALKK